MFCPYTYPQLHFRLIDTSLGLKPNKKHYHYPAKLVSVVWIEHFTSRSNISTYYVDSIMNTLLSSFMITVPSSSSLIPSFFATASISSIILRSLIIFSKSSSVEVTYFYFRAVCRFFMYDSEIPISIKENASMIAMSDYTIHHI